MKILEKEGNQMVYRNEATVEWSQKFISRYNRPYPILTR